MRAVSVEVQVTCTGCQQPVALNAVLPRFECGRCGRAIDVPARVWKLVLEEPVGSELRGGHEKASALTTEVGAFQIVYRRAEPACLACRAPIALDAAVAAAPQYQLACGCGMRAPSRILAPEVGLPSVTALLQEDAELLWPPPPRTEAIALKCAQCGGALAIDGHTPRVTPCTFCRTQVYVPDDLWALLHPVRRVRPFVLVLHAQEPKPKQKGKGGGDPSRQPRWSDVYDLVTDASGGLYAVLELESSGEPELFAIDLEGRVRWRKELPKKLRSDTRLALMRSGHVCVWAGGQRMMIGARASDGTTEAELGSDKSGSGPGARFDLRTADSLACDVDGTILVGEQHPGGIRLVRYAPSGELVPLWPGMPVPTPWSEDEYPTSLDESAERLNGAQAVIVGVGWDGLTYVAGDQSIVCLDRSGKRMWRRNDAEIGLDTGGPKSGRVGAAASGVAFTWDGSSLFRFERERGQAWLHTGEGGLLRDESVVAIAPDGSIWAAGTEGALRRFGPDRGIAWASRGARRADRAAAEDE